MFESGQTIVHNDDESGQPSIVSGEWGLFKARIKVTLPPNQVFLNQSFQCLGFCIKQLVATLSFKNIFYPVFFFYLKEYEMPNVFCFSSFVVYLYPTKNTELCLFSLFIQTKVKKTLLLLLKDLHLEFNNLSNNTKITIFS